MEKVKYATQEQIQELIRLYSAMNKIPFAMNGLTYENAERIIAKMKLELGE